MIEILVGNSYSMGIGGNGVIPGRPHDDFGVGWARTEFSSDFFPFLRERLHLGLDRARGTQTDAR